MLFTVTLRIPRHVVSTILCESKNNIVFLFIGTLGILRHAESGTFPLLQHFERREKKITSFCYLQVLSEFRVMRNEVHVGANVFGTDVYDRVQLHGPTIYPLFLKRISTMNRAPYSNTATFKAIKEMREEFELRGWMFYV